MKVRIDERPSIVRDVAFGAFGTPEWILQREKGEGKDHEKRVYEFGMQSAGSPLLLC
jgi:hypothetical protein